MESKMNDMPISPDRFVKIDQIKTDWGVIPILTVGGTYYDMCRFIGRYFAKEIYEIVERGLDDYLDFNATRGVSTKVLNHKMQQMVNCFKPYLPKTYEQEIQGSYDGCLDAGVTLPNKYFGDFSLAISELGERRCCMLAAQPPATSRDTYHLRQVDQFLGFGFHKYPKIIIRYPQDVHGNPIDIPYVDIGYLTVPGCQAGINREGFCFSQVSCNFKDEMHQSGRPFQLLVQEMIRRCRVAGDAEEILLEKPRTTSEVFILSDPRQNENSLQLYLSSHAKLFNFYQNQMIDLDYIADEPFKHYSPMAGVVYWAGIYKIVESGVEHITSREMHNHLKKYEGKLENHSILEVAKELAHDNTMFSVLFNTTQKEVWIGFAHGNTPAHKSGYIHVDLKKYLQ